MNFGVIARRPKADACLPDRQEAISRNQKEPGSFSRAKRSLAPFAVRCLAMTALCFYA